VTHLEYPQDPPPLVLPAEEPDISPIGDFWLANLFPVRRGIFNPRELFPPVYDFAEKKFPKILRNMEDEPDFNFDVQLLKAIPFKHEGGAFITLGSKNPSIGRKKKNFNKKKKKNLILNILNYFF
jgi:hypothetical protein